MRSTGSAQDLLHSVQQLTVNFDEVTRRIRALLPDPELVVTGRIVTHAMRNLGKAPGEERAIGCPTTPLPNLGYPEAAT